MSATDISLWRLSLAYLLALVPLAVMLWYRIPLLSQFWVMLVRMTLQLFFVGFYLQVLFRLNNPWLNALWLVVMIVVADVSIIHGCGLRLRFFAVPLFTALLAGTLFPLLLLLGPVLQRLPLLDARYAVPIGGMILGNCLRTDIIGLRTFYAGIRDREAVFQLTLAQGATLSEAIRPFLREAYQTAIAPMLATLATIGLVALPGMMTGIMIGGVSPLTAIKYQILVLLAIFSGASIAVPLAVWLSRRVAFDAFGSLKRECFTRSYSSNAAGSRRENAR